jgi:hypothetical protein
MHFSDKAVHFGFIRFWKARPGSYRSIRTFSDAASRSGEGIHQIMHQWDATSLITCAKFEVEGRLVLDYALAAERIVMTGEVQQETVDAGMARGYPDAVAIKERIDSGQIDVRTVEQMTAPFEEVLDLYGLQDADKAVVRLALQSEDVEATVTNDRLLYVVLRRCGHQALFLPDFIEKSVVGGGVYDTATGQQLLLAVRPRLHVGFVEHSLRRLEGVI